MHDSSGAISTHPRQPEQSPAPALGRHIVRGSTWMILNTVLMKAAGLAAQIILAWFLSEKDFGIFAIAISITTLVSVMRDGGVRQLLIARQSEYERLVGPVFWLAYAFNFLNAAMLAVAAPIAARIYHEPQLFWVLLVVAAAVPPYTPVAVLLARLQIDLRFREVATIQATATIVRHAAAVLLAWNGVGPLSFVLPFLLSPLIEWPMALRWAPERLWSRAPHFRLWPEIIGHTKWVLLGTFAMGMVTMGNFFIVGLFVPQDVVGVYFFAFQMVLQVGYIIGANLNTVLFAAFAKLQDEPARLREGIVRSLRQLMLISVPLGAALAPLFPAIEELVWRGRWKAAVLPVQIISLLYPLSVVQSVPYAAQQAWKEFRPWALMLLALAGGVMIAGAAGAALGGTVLWISVVTCAYIALGSLLYAYYGLRTHAHLGLPRIVGAVLPSWVIGLVAAAAAMAAEIPFEGAHPIVRLLVAGPCFALVFTVLARVFIPSHVREAMLVLPGPLSPLARRMLLLTP